MEQGNLFKEDFNAKFLGAYQQGLSDPTNKNHQFDSDTSENGGRKPSPATGLAATVTPATTAMNASVENAAEVMAFGYPVIDFANALMPNGAPVGSRHASALKLAQDLLIICDSNQEAVRGLLLQLQWVKDVVAERGMKELDDIMEAAKKLMHKRESENLNALMPSRNMRRAIEQVAGRKYSQLVRDAQKQLVTAMGDEDKDQTVALLERIGRKLKKLLPHYPLLQLLCHRQKQKHYVAAMLVGGAFLMTLMTRCWYRFWPAPGRQCRLNSLVALIGRMGSGKHIAVDLYNILMEPVKMADKAQVDALNNWNTEREQKSGSSKNKVPRPQGIYRCLPPETSAAAIREAETNAHEEVDSNDFFLHCSIFDSELDNTLRQLKKGYMEQLFTLWLKCFHNEPHGSFLKTSSAHVGEYSVHFNGVYTGTDDALKKLGTESNFVNGLLSRFTIIPMGDSNFEMMEAHKYDDKDRQRDNALRDWAYKLDATKGEIPCENISNALHKWTERRMADARENGSLTEEDLLKRPCWHGINFALPFIVSRHWDQMVQDEDGRWSCPADFKTDKTDIQLAILIAKAQLAFQEHFFMSIGEKYYDDREVERASRGQHQKKTLLAYRRLPNPCTIDDIDRVYGYNGVKGSVYSCLKRLQDDGLLQKIRSGADKGKYRKVE
ncbi:MAG: hypothetical protein IKG81_14620 [Bacteroidales bacterium]|nr:hypothetical protein [Prevotella sp.]MBR3413911.1 hypothetical protein [Bacteroidales bacterium]